MSVNFIITRFKNTMGLAHRLVLPFILLNAVACNAANPYDLNLAFYYGANPPLNQLKLFKNIVVEPSSGVDPTKLQTNNHKIFAYVSLGEAISLTQYGKPIDKSWVIGNNTKWNSIVLDQTNPAWQAFFVDTVITPLWDKGYRGFFLDTLDSFRLAAKTPEQMQKQQDGMIAIIKAIKAKYPEAKLITNRGFEILPQIKPLVDEVISESLFHGWDKKNKRYFEVSAEDRKHLLIELNKVKQMGLPITIIDYVAPDQIGQAKAAAEQITALGFNPWITNGDLTGLYLFSVEIIPRKILLFYQGKSKDIDEKINSYIAQSVSMPLNYLGYVTVVRNLEDPLPKDISPKEYAGVIIAPEGNLLGREQELNNWYLSLLKKKIPFIIFNQFGFPIDNANLKPFGMALPLFTYSPRSLKIIFKSPMMENKADPVFTKEGFLPINLKEGTSLLKLTDETGVKSDIAAITPWGGYFLTDNFLAPTSIGYYRWSINPFQFFKQALRLPDMPVADTTTENGKRLLFIHIDGDGFANRGEGYKPPFTGEIMRKEFLEHYALPTTVSIIQGETASNGLYPELSNQLEKIARQIFALPYIEIASHTFSHPFNWELAGTYDYKKSPINPYTLPIKNYRYNLETEITGSMNYINTRLAPKNKKCKVLLWSGDGDAPEEALKLTYKLGLANLNPGTNLNKFNSSLTRLVPLGIFEGPYFQVFAPIGNDYAAISDENDDLGKSAYFYNLISILDALKITGSPRRLKPINIYMHFFTVAQKGGVKALHKVYYWALSQSIMPIYGSEYFEKAVDFNQLIVAKKDNGWLFETNDALRELRIPITMGYPDLNQSINVIGYTIFHDDLYIHIGPGGEAFIRLTPTAATIPFLMEANGRITRFQRTDKGINFSLKSYIPVKFTLANMESCTVWNGKNKITEQSSKNNIKNYVFEKGTEYDFSIQCG